MSGASDPAQGHTALAKVEHLIVLMMENRSFDHMLGYLKLNGTLPQVEGLQPEMGNPGPDGGFHKVAPIGKRLINEKALDPGHSAEDVAEQLGDRNQGFVKNFVKAFERHKADHPPPPGFTFDPTLVLGYQEANDVPVYDFLARNYAVCDHWFSSFPGPTWENRLYALTGGTGHSLVAELPGLPEKLRHTPIYDREAFVRWLEPEQWRWYSHDPGTLRLADSRYRPGGDLGLGSDENFAYFNRRTLLEMRTFLDDVENDRLPEVAWIDPNFVDFRFLGPPGSNDDHPPSRVMLGQELVLTILLALWNKPKLWEKSMFLITYDEHGGFFDHVVPGDHSIPGDPGRSYGVRVPALVVSPFAAVGVNDTVFDHTSIIKTILTRFSARADEALERLGPRTTAAADLSKVLTDPDSGVQGPPAKPTQDELVNKVADWKIQAYRGQMLEEPTVGERVSAALTDLQGEIAGAAFWLREEAGLPPGRP